MIGSAPEGSSQMSRNLFVRLAGILVAGCAGVCDATEAITDASGAPEEKALLEIQKNTPLLAGPAKDARVIENLAPGAHLVLVTHKQRDGYYRVIRINRGPVAWVDHEAAKIVREKQDVDDPVEEETCASSLNECPRHGCSKTEDPEALANELKRQAPKGPLRATLSFADFGKLQALADERVGQGPPELDQEGRAKLRDLGVSGAAVSEGDLVRAFGHLAKGGEGLHVNIHGESVNCNLRGKSDNDFHIPLVDGGGEADFKGIVVEMIP